MLCENSTEFTPLAETWTVPRRHVSQSTRMNDSSEPLLVEQRTDGITVLTLNNPARRNALDPPLVQALVAAVSNLRSDPTVRCVVVTGNGTAFCRRVPILEHWRGPTEAGCDGRPRPAAMLLRGVSGIPGTSNAGDRCGEWSGSRGRPQSRAELRHSNCCAIGTLRGVLRPFGHPSGRGDNLSPHTPRGSGVAAEMLMSGLPVDADRALAVRLVNPRGR